MNKINLEKILQSLKKGKIIVCPTDTVYGLICDAKNKKAVEKIFKIKKRSKNKPLPVFVRDIKQARKFAYINKNQENFFKKVWPGQVTAILKSKKGLTNLVYKDNTIGLRIPDYELLNIILEKFKKPLAQTSANISGKPTSTKIGDIIKQFKDEKTKPDLVLDAGNLQKNKPSKVIDLTGEKPKILRY